VVEDMPPSGTRTRALCHDLSASLSLFLQGPPDVPPLLMLLCASSNASHPLTGASRGAAPHIAIAPPAALTHSSLRYASFPLTRLRLPLR
jgi:hypothetical protein